MDWLDSSAIRRFKTLVDELRALPKTSHSGPEKAANPNYS
jgi:hypothetical protein